MDVLFEKIHLCRQRGAVFSCLVMSVLQCALVLPVFASINTIKALKTIRALKKIPVR